MVFAFYEAARRNREIEMAENLIVTAIGAQGDKESIEKQLGEWG